MEQRDTDKSVMIYQGVYSRTLYEMELWSLKNTYEYTCEEYEKQLNDDGLMHCGLQKEAVGLFNTKERALDQLEMLYQDPWAEDRELFCAFIRERAMFYMMNATDYLKEWTYIHGLLCDESIVRNYAEDENPFYGRPEAMINFKRGDIVMIPEEYGGHWGIVCETPVTPDHIKEVNERIRKETGIPGKRYSIMDWTDDSYLILTNGNGFESHEHILSHHLLPALEVPQFVRNLLESSLRSANL